MHHTPAILSALVLAASLAGCTAPEGEGSASLYVKDAPSDDFAEVHVVFSAARLHRADAGEDGNGTSDNGGWVELVANGSSIDVDLLNASGTRAAFLGEADLEAGRYTQLRVIVDEAYGVDHDGQRVNITVPSGTIKIVRGFEVEPDRETRIVVDIDLDHSLRQSGQGTWRLTPVVGKTFVEIVDDATSGDEADSEGEVGEVNASA